MTSMNDLDLGEDKFSKWLSTPRAKIKNCQTCKAKEGLKRDILKYIMAYRASLESRQSIPTLAQLFDYIVVEHKYSLSSSSLKRHMRICLGFKPVE
jgi:hypothetical protein